MNDAVRRLETARPLRVAVKASNPERDVALARVVADAGHLVVTSRPDVVLVDGSVRGSHEAPAVTLGGDAEAGVLAPDADAAQIDAALRAVAAGLVVRSREEDGFHGINESDPPLTPRELEVLALIGEGLTNKMIARALDISLHTVKFHVESLFRKIGARTRTEALAKARRRTAEL